MNPGEFVAKWRASQLKESAAYASHFDDLCRLVGHETPLEADPSGDSFAFQRKVATESGRPGFADVWYRGHFGVEYKGKGTRDLGPAFQQLLRYRSNLETPPLLIACNFDTIEIRTDFTGFVSRTYRILLDDLLTGDPLEGSRLTAMQVLHACFYDPVQLRPDQTPEALTKEAATVFGKIAESLRKQWGHSDDAVARYLIRILFCMFASDVGLLPRGIVTEVINANLSTAKEFADDLGDLFAKMSSGGKFWGHQIPFFDGGLFSDGEALEIDGGNLYELRKADQLDWSGVEPSIFGTLFERILNPEKRSQLGAHYTSRADIDTLVEPVLMWPLQREWAQLQKECEPLTSSDKAGPKAKATREQLRSKLDAFLGRLAEIRVLDPACGSGNFLYASLAWLKDLEKQVLSYGADWNVSDLQPRVHPRQLYGIEIDAYAHELASIVVWIGYLQWKYRNGIPFTTEIPILEPLSNIHQMDAILACDASGQPIEPEWPEADVIVGNPPFLGGNRIRRELGDEKVETLFKLYKGRVRPFADLCCYWFAKAEALVAKHPETRVGLLATQAIRGGANREVIESIAGSGRIFLAESDREWVLEGATVRVSMIAFDGGHESRCVLNEQPVEGINANLTSQTDLTAAVRLVENSGVCFMGPSAKAPFDIPEALARRFLAAPPNVNGRPNSDVVRPVASGIDLVGSDRRMWTIDFGLLSLEDAARFELPFEYVKTHVLPVREALRRRDYGDSWWRYARPRVEMRRALSGLPRYLATPEVSKHRVMVWVDANVLGNQQTLVFARRDDYFFGIMQSRPHELWARATGTQLRDAESGFRYTPTTCFEKFPLPWPPGQEPVVSPEHVAISEAARELNELRERWLNPEGMGGEAELKKRTLTNLYNGLGLTGANALSFTTAKPAAARNGGSGSTGPLTSLAPAVASAIFPSNAVRFGAWQPNAPTDFSTLNAVESAINQRMGILMWYQGWGAANAAFDPRLLDAVAARGAIPMITWEPWDYTKGLNQPAYRLSRIAGGAFDSYVRSWATGLKAWGKPVILRFAQEMNAWSYPWCATTNGNKPSDYVAAWRRVRTIFSDSGVTNVAWHWCPNIDWLGSGEVPFDQVFPGDSYVDAVGVDGYNGGTALPWGGWQSFAAIFGYSVQQLRALTSKPIVIGETASAEAGGSKAAWVTEMLDTALPQKFPDIRAVIWFSEAKETDWRMQSSTASLDAFRSGLAGPYYLAA
jgi:Glycosyl hydrolase family 26